MNKLFIKRAYLKHEIKTIEYQDSCFGGPEYGPRPLQYEQLKTELGKLDAQIKELKGE